MADPADRFDSAAFFRALESTALARGLKWKEVGQQTGISASTLSRMAQGKGPDAASLAVLSAWAGLNPGDFTHLASKRTEPEPLARLTAYLARDPKLSRKAAGMLDGLIKATYESLIAKER